MQNIQRSPPIIDGNTSTLPQNSSNLITPSETKIGRSIFKNNTLNQI